jgi:hypothetical protein
MMMGQELLPVVGELNHAFSKNRIHTLAPTMSHFAPGQPLGPALAAIVGSSSQAVHDVFRTFIEHMPGGIQESIRSIIYYALNTTPPTLLTFAWAPAYDWQLTTWQVVEPKPANSGITLLINSRYPNDPLPPQ